MTNSHLDNAIKYLEEKVLVNLLDTISFLKEEKKFRKKYKLRVTTQEEYHFPYITLEELQNLPSFQDPDNFENIWRE